MRDHRHHRYHRGRNTVANIGTAVETTEAVAGAVGVGNTDTPALVHPATALVGQKVGRGADAGGGGVVAEGGGWGRGVVGRLDNLVLTDLVAWFELGFVVLVRLNMVLSCRHDNLLGMDGCRCRCWLVMDGCRWLVTSEASEEIKAQVTKDVRLCCCSRLLSILLCLMMVLLMVESLSRLKMLELRQLCWS